jgi:mono/diheme cytochrome c family protein
MTGASRNALAPPLRDLFKRYPIYALDEAFARGLEVGHRGMPRFTFSSEERAAILSYIESLNPCARPSSDDAAMARCFEPM